jgi:hypothetical protein
MAMPVMIIKEHLTDEDEYQGKLTGTVAARGIRRNKNIVMFLNSVEKLMTNFLITKVDLCWNIVPDGIEEKNNE